MIGPVLEFADLQRMSGYTRRADVEAWAERIGLAVRPSRDGLVSSVDAFNRTLGIAANDSEHYAEWVS